MSGDLILGVVSLVLFILAGVFAAKWMKAKIILKEVAEALNVTYDALNDNTISKEEKTKILKEWADVAAAVKGFLGAFKK